MGRVKVKFFGFSFFSFLLLSCLSLYDASQGEKKRGHVFPMDDDDDYDGGYVLFPSVSLSCERPFVLNNLLSLSSLFHALFSLFPFLLFLPPVCVYVDAMGNYNSCLYIYI